MSTDVSRRQVLYLSKDGKAAFAADVPAATFRLIQATQRPFDGDSFIYPTQAAAWQTIPTWGPGRRPGQSDPAGVGALDVQPCEGPQGRRSADLVPRRDDQSPQDHRRPHRGRREDNRLTGPCRSWTGPPAVDGLPRPRSAAGSPRCPRGAGRPRGIGRLRSCRPGPAPGAPLARPAWRNRLHSSARRGIGSAH
jgi:hypothetical protein